MANSTYPIQSLLSRLSSEYIETGFEVDNDKGIGGDIQDYDEAVEELAKLDRMLADLQVNGYVAVHYGAYRGWLPSIIDKIHDDKNSCKVWWIQQLSTENSFMRSDPNSVANHSEYGPIDIDIDNIVAVLDPPTLKSRYWSFSKANIDHVHQACAGKFGK